MKYIKDPVDVIINTTKLLVAIDEKLDDPSLTFSQVCDLRRAREDVMEIIPTMLNR